MTFDHHGNNHYQDCMEGTETEYEIFIYSKRVVLKMYLICLILVW